RALPSNGKADRRIRKGGGVDAEYSCRRGRQPLAGGHPDAAGADPLDRRDAEVVAGLLSRLVRLGRRVEVHLPSAPDPALRGRDLVHATVALYDSLPSGAREVRGDDGPELVGRGPGGVVLLGGPL